MFPASSPTNSTHTSAVASTSSLSTGESLTPARGVTDDDAAAALAAAAATAASVASAGLSVEGIEESPQDSSAVLSPLPTMEEDAWSTGSSGKLDKRG